MLSLERFYGRSLQVPMHLTQRALRTSGDPGRSAGHVLRLLTSHRALIRGGSMRCAKGITNRTVAK